jgi:hypothetical protein
VYRTVSYECHYRQENEERNVDDNIAHASVLPQYNAQLFRRRAQLAICDRGIALCHHRRHLSVANFRCRKCSKRISLAHRRRLTYHYSPGTFCTGRLGLSVSASSAALYTVFCGCSRTCSPPMNIPHAPSVNEQATASMTTIRGTAPRVSAVPVFLQSEGSEIY